MSAYRPSVLAVAALACLALAGCGTVKKVFTQKPPPKATLHGERIPLVALNQKLEVAAALQGVEFFIPDPVPVAEWPQPGGTPGAWTDNIDAAHQFDVAWKKDFGLGSNRRLHVTAPPVGAQGRIFVMDGAANVSAMDATTGARIWHVDLGRKDKRDREGFGGGVAFADGKVYVASGYRFVAALNAADGKLLWKVQVSSPIHAAPLVAEGRVYAIDTEDELQSFNAETGAPDWTYQALTEPARILHASSPALAGDAVIAAFASGEIVSLRATNGNELWSQSLAHSSRTNALSEIRDIAGRPVVYQGDVFAGSHSGLFAATDLRNGSTKWSLPAASISSPWPAGDVVYFVSKAGQVICASRENGSVYWITDLNKGPKGKHENNLWFGPVLASSQLVLVSDKGRAVALNPKTGALLHSIKLGGNAAMGPIAMNGMLYVVTEQAQLIAIR